VPLVGGARLPLAFVGGGLLALALAGLWTARLAAEGALSFAHPHVVALAHVWLPGFLLSICLGASYQLMPVVLGVPLRAGLRSLWVHAVLHAAGVVMLVIGLAGGRYVLAGLGGLALVVGVTQFAVATFATFAASKRRDAPAWSFPLAAGWLWATVLAGVVLAANRHAPFLPLSALDLLRAHAHLGLVGYFLSLLQGVTFQLVPMFTMGRACAPRWAAGGLACTQVGVTLLATGLAGAWSNPTWLGTALVLGGMACSGTALIATLRSRRRRVLDPGLKAFVAGAVVLAMGALWGGALAAGAFGSERVVAAAAVYGLLAMAGGLSLAVLGMLCKILPFLVWMIAYGPRVGREPVPAATGLASRRLEQTWLGMHLAGLALLGAGVFVESQSVMTMGGALLVAGIACYLVNALRVLAHVWRGSTVRFEPRRPQPASAAPLSP